MSRGPGRIERAIRALFDAHPDAVFSAEALITHCYHDEQRIERKHLVAVVRAAKNVVARDPDWACQWSVADSRRRVFYNQASVVAQRDQHAPTFGRAWARRLRDASSAG